LIVYVAELDGETLVEPSGETAPTSGEMLSCVALVDDQLRVVASPLLMVSGLACKVTVGRAAGGGGGGGAGGGAAGFFAQPIAKTRAVMAVKKQVR
jgi:hypothetical protein